MSALIPSFGNASQFADLTLILNDMLNGMGNYLSQEPGTLNYIEAVCEARILADLREFMILMSNQLSPASVSVLIAEWAQIYNISAIGDTAQTQQYIENQQVLFGTPPTYSNLLVYFQNLLGNCFIDLEVRPELQHLATTDPNVQVEQDGYSYASPLSKVMVYVWQPRDNQDNLLMSNADFNSLIETYHATINSWNPSYSSFQTMNLTNRGNQDGYGGGYNGSNYNNYVDGYNVVYGTAGSPGLSGINTTFFQYPNGVVGDLQVSILQGYNPPIQIVDDLGILQTYYVASVVNNTQVNLTTRLVNNVTNRTYRLLGCLLDTKGMLDGGQLMNA